MDNLKDWINHARKDEEVEAIVIGENPWTDEKIAIPEDKIGILLTWAEAEPMLDYEFDRGFGSAGCHPVTVWTKSKIICISEYDGSTGIFTVPRNPTEYRPYYT